MRSGAASIQHDAISSATHIPKGNTTSKEYLDLNHKFVALHQNVRNVIPPHIFAWKKIVSRVQNVGGVFQL